MANIDLYMQKLSNIADAIRNKLGEQNEYTLEQMPGKILSIPTGGSSTIVQKNITSNGTYYASSDNADGYSPVVVDVPTPQPVLITKSITQNGTYAAQDDNADGYSSVTVNVPSSSGTCGLVLQGFEVVTPTPTEVS